MVKLAVKVEEIKIRLTKEQKDLIKRVAKQQGITMSAFILKYMEPIAMSKELDIKHKEVIEARIEETEGNLQWIKDNMEIRKGNKNKKWFFNIFARS